MKANICNRINQQINQQKQRKHNSFVFRVTHEIRKMFHATKRTCVLVKKREKGSEVIAEINGESDEDKD